MKDAVVVEIGCDNGRMLPHFVECLSSFDKVTAFVQSDLVPSQMVRRESYLKEHPIPDEACGRAHAMMCNGERLPLGDQTVDVVFMMEVFEHMEMPHRGLFECARVLKPGGICIVTTPRPSAAYYHVALHNRKNAGYYTPVPWPDYAPSDENFWKYIYEAGFDQEVCIFHNVRIPGVMSLLEKWMPRRWLPSYVWLQTYALPRIFPLFRKAQFRVLRKPKPA